MSKFILDTTVWLNFARADAVDLLVEGLQGRLVVGMIVRHREMRTWPRACRRAGEAFSFDTLIEGGVVEYAEMTADELARFSTTKTAMRLGDGETEAFVLAFARGWTIATDDGAARRRFSLAKESPVITGAIGLLRLLVAADVVTRDGAIEMLRLMRERGGRLPHEGI